MGNLYLIKMQSRTAGEPTSYIQDVQGALSTCISITAGIINLTNGGSDDLWKHAYLSDLLWSGIIEVSAIALVFVTDSDFLRAIGGWSMVGVNSYALHNIWNAEQAEHSDTFRLTYTMHAIALGQALDIWINTYLIDGATGEFKSFPPWETIP